jgi:hypothetical protein
MVSIIEKLLIINNFTYPGYSIAHVTSRSCHACEYFRGLWGDRNAANFDGGKPQTRIK